MTENYRWKNYLKTASFLPEVNSIIMPKVFMKSFKDLIIYLPFFFVFFVLSKFA